MQQALGAEILDPAEPREQHRSAARSTRPHRAQRLWSDAERERGAARACDAERQPRAARQRDAAAAVGGALEQVDRRAADEPGDAQVGGALVELTGAAELQDRAAV